jgi:hypothetical protein
MSGIKNKKSCSLKNNHTAAFLILVLFCSCGTSKIDRSAQYQINFLDEYIYELPESFRGNKIGGLSGIDYNGSKYVLISDKSKSPEIYTVDIKIENLNISSVEFQDVNKVSCSEIDVFDAESIRYLPDESGYLITTEGNINRNKNPEIIEVDESGICKKTYKLPQHFKIELPNKPRQNRVFEGLSLDHEKSGFWVANEIPLKDDGKTPKLFNTNSPVRLTHYPLNGQKPDYQVSYDLDRLIKIPILPFGVNGLTEIIQIDQDHLLVLERSFSAGHKTKGHRLKIFLVNVTNASNTLKLDSLKKFKATNLDKVLLFDSKFIKGQLELKLIDNVEGITFGPVLSNGNKSLILVSDNNFNTFGKQLNQFILLELINTNPL